MPVSNIGQFALPMLRTGLVILFLWFGLSQVMAPGDWVAWVPQWTESLGLSATMIVLLNGLFEVVLGVLLAIGFYTRVAALLLSLHLFFVAYEVGYNDIGMRDFALAVATLSLAMFEPDQCTVDKRTKKE
ncbi:hypothetical protein A2853_01820 [Candidatus Kaiserbacteria bacterium RIFCSPHIGHO2_01_FULL_55_17]|uniref:DoxX family protein n=1 Tax=Candidatus Kaiserbacteria bacterium RIFCSPHIGHO2_01_FULL_55_17 TaxID=1798484 RepID=A0A1F6D850_9BACT|nr:MAG: hypothetical protein A2853_01820 [Candidatus Kaiserbacteria bacterium RIFCSPHIGHO2_01_FULL_55_17]